MRSSVGKPLTSLKIITDNQQLGISSQFKFDGNLRSKLMYKAMKVKRFHGEDFLLL